MIDVLRMIENGDRTNLPGVQSTGKGGGVIPVCERLSEAELSEMLRQFRTGAATRQQLADQYGVSLSTMKRLLRRHREH
ncbi:MULTISPECIES: hypothetical protein [Streptacidiphilus]|uniref:Uncharacterized protein n=1 Tax=Streptacidiphilus cavernicola TaxID=3342716 RepID=A0ABV6ULS9_9ACTN|nr:hypothetical protein [Streptacidiphilus jeojiense]